MLRSNNRAAPHAGNSGGWGGGGEGGGGCRCRGGSNKAASDCEEEGGGGCSKGGGRGEGYYGKAVRLEVMKRCGVSEKKDCRECVAFCASEAPNASIDSTPLPSPLHSSLPFGLLQQP
jgi:hypothetical protein